MYMIAGLCMLKLYQTRHPDINASAYSAYASFAVVITLTVLGVVGPSPSAFSPALKSVPLEEGVPFGFVSFCWALGAWVWVCLRLSGSMT